MASCWEDWQSTKNTVLERSRHMFNNPFMSDVVLTCEGSDKKFFAHKYVLATSSAVFYAMFYGKLAEKNSVVHLSDTNEESLQEFLRFLYTDECELTTDNAMLVLYLANKYIVPSLAQKCITLLEANITTANIFTVLQQATQICEEKLQNRCWDMIDLNTSEVVTSNAFIDIDHAILLQFLKRETLKIKETDLFLAVLRWSEAECLRKRIESNAKNKRAVLGNAIYEIRFASMTAQEFAQNISGTGLLTTEEMVLFYETFSGKEKASEIWNMSERGASLKAEILLRCSRFVGHKCFEKNLGTYQTVGVSFSKPVRLHGVRLFGYLRCEYDVTLEVFTQQVQKKGYADEDSRGVPGFDVLLPAPIKIQADVPVHLKATILGPKSTFGVEGRVTVNVNHMTVTFFEIIEHRRHYIPVKYGQFDQIIFSEC